jgi:hypothetical protein
MKGMGNKENPHAGIEYIVRIAKGELDEANTRKWVKQHLKKL